MIRQLLRLAMMVGVCAAPCGTENGHPIVANIDARQTAEPVSNYVFGMFIEHIGKTMCGPLWPKYSMTASSRSRSLRRRTNLSRGGRAAALVAGLPLCNKPQSSAEGEQIGATE